MKYVKILHETLKHHGFQYKLGLNEDTIPLNTSGTCEPGGLYFTDFDNFAHFLEFGTLIADVEVPQGTEIYADSDSDNNLQYKWKASRIIISNIRPIKSLPEWHNLDFCLSAIKRNRMALQYFNAVDGNHFDSEDYKIVCSLLLKQSGLNLRYVSYQTEEIVLTAVKQNGHALQYVPMESQSEEIYLEAVKQNGYCLEHVVNRTYNICLEAVKQNGHALQLVPIELRLEEICLEAVKQNGHALQYVPMESQSEEIYLDAVKQNGYCLEHVVNRTYNICLEAVKQNGHALQLVPIELRLEEICLEAVKQNGHALQYVPMEYYDICYGSIN